MIDGDQRACAGADRSRALRRAADQKSRIVDEIHHRNVERVADIDQANHFVARRSVGRAAAVARIVRDHAHRIAVQSREPG